MMDRDEFEKTFTSEVERLAMMGAVHPLPFLWLGGLGESHSTIFDTTGPEALDRIARTVREKQPLAFAFGLDRYSKPEHGTERTDVFTYTVYWQGLVKHGIIEYDAHVVDPPREDNRYWNDIMSRLFSTRFAPLLASGHAAHP